MNKLAQIVTLAAALGFAGQMPYIPQRRVKEPDPERMARAQAKRDRKAAKRLRNLSKA